MRTLYSLFIKLSTFSFCLSLSYDDTFKEELFVKPLPAGEVYTQFKFSVETNFGGASKPFKHFRLFPRSFGEIISKHSVQELHFSLTQGLWRYEKWGYPYRGAPPGLELWTWFHKNTSSVSLTWKKLVNVLSGQFCASLNFIDDTNTVIPKRSFYPEGAIMLDESYNSSYLRYATLPNEVVCTENLTPFKKLLPCDTSAGLSTLLNAVNMFGTHYFSLAVDYKTVCKADDCSTLALSLVQSVSVVFYPPIKQRGKQDWSFVKLFGSAIMHSCPLATKSFVYVDISSNQTGIPFALRPPPSEIIQNQVNNMTPENKKFAVYDLKRINEPRPLNIAAVYKSVHIHWLIPPPPLYANRYIQGYGQEHGGIHCTLYNSHSQKPIKVLYLEVIPWFLRVYSHTLLIQSGSTVIKPEYVHYRPGRDRERPYHLEIMFTVSPLSTIEISIEFDYAFLKWTEYPPDANHGFYIGPAVISTLLENDRNFTIFPVDKNVSQHSRGYFMRVYTPILLVTLPTPDFSMPYNVICLVCTVLALAFGPIHNITTKRLQPVSDDEDEGLVKKLKRQAKNFKERLMTKQDEQVDVNTKKEQ